MSRFLFGALLAIVGLVYLWLAYQAVTPGLQSGDLVNYLGAALFLAAGLGAGFAAVNLLRTRRR
jgi:hypothetical protein